MLFFFNNKYISSGFIEIFLDFESDFLRLSLDYMSLTEL